MMDNITPRKCLIVGSGIKNHSEFVELCKERIGEIHSVSENLNERQKAAYLGGETRIFAETPMTSISLAFESVPWTHED